jgi:hypothetical protein
VRGVVTARETSPAFASHEPPEGAKVCPPATLGKELGESVILLMNRRFAEYINYSWSLASPSAIFTFDDLRQNFPGTEVRLANSPTYSCRSDRQCNVDQCSRPAGRCGWSCTHCIGGGWSKICADDPVCLSTRTACNVKENVAVARCNADQALKKVDCERLKGQENLGCEIGKGFVDSLRSITAMKPAHNRNGS